MNILFITIDSLKSSYFDENIAPGIFNVINDSIFFKNMVSNAPATPSSFRSILTGCYWRTLSEDERKRRMITNIYKNFNYNTLAVQSNTPLTIQDEFREGFDIYEDKLVPWLVPKKSEILQKFLEKIYYYYMGTPSISAKATTDKCLKLIDKTNGDFFFWQHYMNVHVPYFLKSRLNIWDKYKANKIFQKAKHNPEKLSENEKQYLRKAYEKEVERVDKEIARLLRGIKERGLWDDTIIIITSDHGDAFGLHGRYFHPADFIYEETTRIPLLMRIPGKEGKEIDELVSSIDLKPTLIDLLDLKGDYKTHGTSLVPLIEGKSISRNGVLIFGNDVVALRKKRWKYIYNIKDEKGELYDLEKDPDELNNLAEERDDKVHQMHEQLKVKMDELDNLDMDIRVHDYKDTDKEVESRLRALGYMD